MKKSVGSNTYLFPLPSVVVGTYDKNNQANMMVASWTGVVNSKPSMVSVSLREATHSHNSIIERGAFTISIPSKKHIVEMDYAGTLSGRNTDKFGETGLTPVASELVEAPYVGEFPVVIECRLVKYDDTLGMHTMFIGEIVDIKIDRDYLKENGMPDMERIDPVAYAHGDREYYEIGEYLGKANRMWQGTHLNKVINSDPQKMEILSLVERYYEGLDGSREIEAFHDLIDWQGFRMVNGSSVLDSYEVYSRWYEDIKNTMFDRKHIIEKLDIARVDDLTYRVEMDMYFRGRTWKKGEAKAQKIEVRAKIEWTVVREVTDKEFKLTDYIIYEG